ncbi:uncharacterized protein BP5553_01706 [Venustampulla echinocandica]|uniref:Uncharacterized protein n=1 Tax=Venustampulla echinocandica TaxID=2656787 RepID=A0A370U1S8_9HELO|nr:uncharacterized protein BP5553_01706 [Venustampulla echinocandica]RDL41727.1 hypothetical protein BP5553_01706 [Venustampulla echinocandica]
MSGFEILAAVTSITAAFKGSAALVVSWQEGKRERQDNGHNQRLLRSLTYGAARVKYEYDQHFARLGPRLSSGISRAELGQCLVQLQHLNAMITMESAGAHPVVMPSLATMLAMSDNTRERAVAILEEQYQRMAGQVDLPLPFVSRLHRCAIRGSVASETGRGVFRRASTARHQTGEIMASRYSTGDKEPDTKSDRRPRSWMNQQVPTPHPPATPRPLSEGFYS